MDSIVSISAIIISLFSVLYSVTRNRKMEYKLRLSANLQMVGNIELKLVENPDLLICHGISIIDIEKTGLTPKQFGYLVASFTSGSLFFRQMRKIKNYHSFNPGGYRYNMVLNKEVRKAWPLLKRLMEPSIYRDKIEETINMIEKNGI